MLVLKKHLHLLFRGSKEAVDVDHGWYDGGGQELDKNEMAFFVYFFITLLFLCFQHVVQKQMNSWDGSNPPFLHHDCI